MKISICIVEDNDGIRYSLEEIIKMDERYELLASFSNGKTALEKIPFLKPNIVLMDINLGLGKNGIECIKILKSKIKNVLFMVCTIYEDDKKIFEALSAGANAYILKKTTPEKLLSAINELYEGGAPMSGEIARKIVLAFQNGQVGDISENEKSLMQLDKLTKRENEILKMLSQGLLYKEIAQTLFLSQETIRKHVYNIYDKLHVKNRVEAINKLYER